MDRASSESRKMLDSNRQNEIHQNSGLHETRQLFYNLILATETHSMEYVLKTKEYRVSNTSEQPYCICTTTQNQAHYLVCRPCIISRNATSNALSQTAPNPESNMVREERSKQ
jgi:hypothetical protein